MAAAKDKSTASSAAPQFARGYLVSEDQAYVMQDMAQAMTLIGELFDQAGEERPEMPGTAYGALFRTFARQVDNLRQGADFTFDAKIAPRDLH